MSENFFIELTVDGGDIVLLHSELTGIIATIEGSVEPRDITPL